MYLNDINKYEYISKVFHKHFKEFSYEFHSVMENAVLLCYRTKQV